MIPKLLPRGLLVTFGVLACGLLADEKTKTLDVHWIDSEGGGSTLLVTPAGESVLIDAGNPGGRDPARIVAAAKAAGLTRIDYFLLTHFHTDHFGGAAEVAQQIPIGTIYQRAIPDGDPDGRAQSSFPLQIKPFREIAARREPLAPGTVIPLKSPAGGPPLTLRCLGADKSFVAPTAAQRGEANPLTGRGEAKTVPPSDNDNCAVFVLQFGGFRMFDGGDLTWNFEERLVTPHNLVGSVDVYQTNHHGLAVSSNPILVQSIAPTVVVMNNGPVKGGQPGAFAAIRSAKSVQALFQVHQSYNVPVETNAPREFIANHDNLTGAAAAKCPAHPVKMVVAADARGYEISIPATGFARTFQTRTR
ncbi:MAG: MBL fold metallo-hydrolase [Verrucomicrobia bacterium]|nr:MBL fold metallo-hydrolase [Verrucomicrobiota bacterium]